MIVFDLKCLDGGETFECWFGSSADFDDQSARGLIQCPHCRSSRVEKAPMAPRVPRRTSGRLDARTAVESLAALQAEMLAGSEWVGRSFADTARAMHLREMEPRPVHGEASIDDARSLAEDGVPILPLPLPVVPPGQVN